MADDITQPVEVSLEPEQKELDLGQPKQQAPAESPPQPKPKVEGVEVLRTQLAEMQNRMEMERKGREEAERIGRQRMQEIQQYERRYADAQTSIVDSQYQTIVNTIDAFKRDSELAKRDYAAALSNGNFDAVAEAQSRLARSEAQIVQLENGRAQLEEQQKQYATQREQQLQNPQQRQYTPQERFDNYVQQFSPRAQSYLRQHPEYATDAKLNGRLLRAHGEAVDDFGITPDSEDYYRFLDEKMGGTQQQRVHQQQPVARRYGPAPAPVSRAPLNGSSMANSVTLSPAEREAARIAGISEVEYAKQMLALESAGQIVRH